MPDLLSFVYPHGMRLFPVLLLCGFAASACSLSAQTTSATNTGSAAVSNPTAASTTQKTSTGTATVPALRLESLPPEPHTLTPEQIAQLRAEQIANAATELARNQAAWGAEHSTPGTSLTMIEAGSKQTPEGLLLTYTFKATGFREGDNLRLVRWPLDQSLSTLTDGLTVDDQGQLICPAITQGECLSSMQPGQLAQLSTTAARGEAIRVAVYDVSSKRHAETTSIPFPALYSSPTCKMEMILSVRNAALVLLEGVGFPPSQMIHLTADTNGTAHPLETKSSAKGQILIAFMPSVAHEKSGNITVSYAGQSCKATLSFPWGLDSYHAVMTNPNPPITVTELPAKAAPQAKRRPTRSERMSR